MARSDQALNGGVIDDRPPEPLGQCSGIDAFRQPQAHDQSLVDRLARIEQLFLDHAMAEHRDFRLLEQNYVASGGELATIHGADKNIGSEALSGFMYHAASKPDPLGLLGAMFIIEGLGSRLAGPWAKLVEEQLGLREEAISFFKYHGENDEHHMEEFDRAIELAATDEATSNAIVKHAKVVARLYRLQLEELDHV